MSKYTIFFERFIGRHLARWESEVIASLEYTRQHGDNHRVAVVDEPGYDSRLLLCAYFNYLHHRVDTFGDFLVMAKTKRDATSLSGFISRAKTPWLTTASGRKPDNIRGLTFNYALLLDTDSYNTQLKNSKSKIQHSKFSEALRAVAPIILNKGKNNFIIIHIRNESTIQNSTFNITAEVPPIYLRDPSVPQPRFPQKIPSPQVYYLTLNASPPTTLNSQPSTLNFKLSTLNFLLNPKLSAPHSI